MTNPEREMGRKARSLEATSVSDEGNRETI